MLGYTTLTSVVVLLWYESYNYTSWYKLLFIMIFFYTQTCCYLVIFLLSVYNVIQLSFIFSLSCYYYVHTVYMHGHFSFSYTLTGSLSDDLGFAHPNIGCFLILFRCSLSSYASQGAGISPYLIQVFLPPFFIPVYVLFLIPVYQIQSLF